MLIKFEITNVIMFKHIINVVHNIISEVNFICNEKGINIHATDSTLITLIDIILPKKWFSKCYCPKSYKLGIDLIALSAIITDLTSSYVLSIQHNSMHTYLEVILFSKGILY